MKESENREKNRIEKTQIYKPPPKQKSSFRLSNIEDLTNNLQIDSLMGIQKI